MEGLTVVAFLAGLVLGLLIYRGLLGWGQSSKQRKANDEAVIAERARRYAVSKCDAEEAERARKRHGKRGF